MAAAPYLADSGHGSMHLESGELAGLLIVFVGGVELGVRSQEGYAGSIITACRWNHKHMIIGGLPALTVAVGDDEGVAEIAETSVSDRSGAPVAVAVVAWLYFA